jgi:hypothetical protein
VTDAGKVATERHGAGIGIVGRRRKFWIVPKDRLP